MNSEFRQGGSDVALQIRLGALTRFISPMDVNTYRYRRPIPQRRQTHNRVRMRVDVVRHRVFAAYDVLNREMRDPEQEGSNVVAHWTRGI